MRNVSKSGIALIFGGLLVLIVNAVITPFLPSGDSFAATAASPVFLLRQILSAFAAFSLLAGSVGLFLHRSDRFGRVGMCTFGLAFLGSALLLAHEWGQIFIVHDLALHEPKALEALEDVAGATFSDIGAMIAVVTFAVGWIAFSVSILIFGAYVRLGPVLLLIGFFATPMLAAALPPMLGLGLGNAILASGWFFLGHELYRSQNE
jgi:hypothetical protein